jgi:hypothetical protein
MVGFSQPYNVGFDLARSSESGCRGASQYAAAAHASPLRQQAEAPGDHPVDNALGEIGHRQMPQRIRSDLVAHPGARRRHCLKYGLGDLLRR